MGATGATGAQGPQGPAGGSANAGSITGTIDMCVSGKASPASALVYVPGHAFTGYSDPTTGNFNLDTVVPGMYTVNLEQKGNSAVAASVSPVTVTANTVSNLGVIEFGTQSDTSNCGACGVVCASGDTCVSGSCQAPSCSYVSVAPTPVGAINLGTLGPGNTAVVTGGPLSMTGTASQDWYEVTVLAPELQSGVVVNPTANPRFQLSGDVTDYVFDVYFNTNENSAATACDTNSSAVGLFHFFGTNYSAGDTGYFCTLPNSPQVLYVRVYRLVTSSNSSCGQYTLNLSD
jgi:hypothetical protein